MMLADPDGMESERLGMQRLGDDVGDELVGRARIVLVVVVAQREITEIEHRPSPNGFFNHRPAAEPLPSRNWPRQGAPSSSCRKMSRVERAAEGGAGVKIVVN